jgi:DNA polymerase-3 subunit epsilon
MPRDLIVVDFETTGLHDRAVIVEAAAINVETGTELYFVPEFLGTTPWSDIEPIALKINGYFERELWKEELSGNETRKQYANLLRMLEGNTFAGSNPSFDSKLLLRSYRQSWHHRLGDLAAYAAGKLDLDPTDLPGLDEVGRRLEIDITGRHGALDDARATAKAFQILRTM